VVPSALPVLAENSLTTIWVAWRVTAMAMILVPSGVMIALPATEPLGQLGNVAARALAHRSPPGAVVSSKRTLMAWPASWSTARVLPSAVHDNELAPSSSADIYPSMRAPCAPRHTRTDPLRRSNSLSSEGPDWLPRATASLPPSGDSAMPLIALPMPGRSGCAGAGSGVRRAMSAAGSRRSRKNAVALRAAGAGADPVTGPRPYAASTKVRSSAAPVTQVKLPYPRGGLRVARTAPGAVALTPARVDGEASG